MIKEISKIKSIDEIEVILKEHEPDYYFSNIELKTIEKKNRIKSLGARYLIKKSVLNFLELDNNYLEIEIENDRFGKPIISLNGKVKEKIDENHIQEVQISISHSKKYISTLVVFEKDV